LQAQYGYGPGSRPRALLPYDRVAARRVGQLARIEAALLEQAGISVGVELVWEFVIGLAGLVGALLAADALDDDGLGDLRPLLLLSFGVNQKRWLTPRDGTDPRSAAFWRPAAPVDRIDDQPVSTLWLRRPTSTS
jgi:hypothetical protein